MKKSVKTNQNPAEAVRKAHVPAVKLNRFLFFRLSQFCRVNQAGCPMQSDDLRDKIAVLEDDPDVAMVVERVIVRAGLKPLLAVTCMDVQRHLKAGGVAALIADLMLSAHGCRGSDVALRALMTDPAIKILFISGTFLSDWSPADRENVAALPEGSFDFLLKPFTGRVLLERLAALLRLPAQPPRGICCPEYATCLDVAPPTLAQIMAAPSRRHSWC